MKRIGSLEALLNVISDRSGCTQNQIFGYILGISLELHFENSKNRQKNNDISLVQLAFYTHSFKALAKNLNQMFWIPDPSLNLEALLFPKIDVHVPHLHSVRYPIDNYCILLL